MWWIIDIVGHRDAEIKETWVWFDTAVGRRVRIMETTVVQSRSYKWQTIPLV